MDFVIAASRSRTRRELHFDEVAYLLLYDDLPNKTQLAAFQSRVNAARLLTQPIRDLLTGRQRDAAA
jgi:2-methylcitrate synthase